MRAELLCSMWDPSSWPETEPVLLALQGSPPNTGPSGKSPSYFWSFLLNHTSCLSSLPPHFLPFSLSSLVFFFNLCLTCRWWCLCKVSQVWFFVTAQTVVHQAPLFIGFSKQVYWRGLPFPPAGDLLDLGTEFLSLVSFCIGRWVLYHCATWEALHV